MLDMCQSLGGLNVGRAKITPAYNLPCKYVIHTVGPWWNGGDNHEKNIYNRVIKKPLKLQKEQSVKASPFL